MRSRARLRLLHAVALNVSTAPTSATNPLRPRHAASIRPLDRRSNSELPSNRLAAAHISRSTFRVAGTHASLRACTRRRPLYFWPGPRLLTPLTNLIRHRPGDDIWLTPLKTSTTACSEAFLRPRPNHRICSRIEFRHPTRTRSVCERLGGGVVREPDSPCKLADSGPSLCTPRGASRGVFAG
jgi:hypothetical protein